MTQNKFQFVSKAVAASGCREVAVRNPCGSLVCQFECLRDFTNAGRHTHRWPPAAAIKESTHSHRRHHTVLSCATHTTMAAYFTPRALLLVAVCTLIITLSGAQDYNGPLLSKLVGAEQLGEGAPRAPRSAFGPGYGGGFGGGYGRHHPGFGGGYGQPGCAFCGGGFRPGGVSGSFSKSSSSSSSGSINFGRKK